MIHAQRHHEQTVLDLIGRCFRNDPQFLAYTQGHPAKIRLIARLIFETCLASNTIFLTDDLNAVALCKPGGKPPISLRVLWLQFLFPFVLGPRLLMRLMRIEHALEKQRQLQTNDLYVWLLATHPAQQGKGLASQLLAQISQRMPNPYSAIVLETSTASNRDYYTKRGYQGYHAIEFDHDLSIFMMRKTIQSDQAPQ
jgi:ribosomal protein S18 acetylase RimI-like enzyme